MDSEKKKGGKKKGRKLRAKFCAACGAKLDKRVKLRIDLAPLRPNLGFRSQEEALAAFARASRVKPG